MSPGFHSRCVGARSPLGGWGTVWISLTDHSRRATANGTRAAAAGRAARALGGVKRAPGLAGVVRSAVTSGVLPSLTKPRAGDVVAYCLRVQNGDGCQPGKRRS